MPTAHNDNNLRLTGRGCGTQVGCKLDRLSGDGSSAGRPDGDSILEPSQEARVVYILAINVSKQFTSGEEV